MNRYLTKLAGILGAKLGMPAGQPVANQTLQVMSQVGDKSTRREARGTMNLKARGDDNHPRPSSILTQKMPKIKT